DVLNLLAPTAVIHPERFETTVALQLVETRLDDAQQGSRRGDVRCKLDKAQRFPVIVLGRIDRVRMPGEREQPLRLHFLDHGLPSDMLIAGVGYLPTRNLPRHKRSVQTNAEPRAELMMISQGSPDAGDRGLEFDGLFDAITHAQPPGCSLGSPSRDQTQPFYCSFKRTMSKACRPRSSAYRGEAAGARREAAEDGQRPSNYVQVKGPDVSCSYLCASQNHRALQL